MMDSLTGKRILIVDDEPDILETLSELLSQCIIDTATSCDAAKQLLAEKTFDAAILDIMGVNGYDLLELCRQKQIPAVMLTAHALISKKLKWTTVGSRLGMRMHAITATWNRSWERDCLVITPGA